MYPDRLPPNDIAAEEAVLGSLLLDDEATFKIAGVLTPDDFFREKNRWVYEACSALYERREPINQITLAHELAMADRLESVGGHAYLNYLVSAVPTSVFVESYAETVRRTGLMRRLIEASGQIAALGLEGGPDTEQVLDKAEDVLFRLRGGRSPQDFVHMRQIVDAYLAGSEEASARSAELPHVPTGFERMDRLLGGLHRSDLVILAARPGMGKTSLALGIAYSAAKEKHARVAVFSMEMSKEQLLERLLSTVTNIDMQRLRLGHLEPAHLTVDEHDRLIEGTATLSDLDIYIDDSPMLTPTEMRGKARRLSQEVGGLDLIVLDYMQLMNGTSANENRVQQMGEISRSLKGIARELSLPVMALSQLNRAVEQRQPHIPQLADLRESGSIEQDADVVMFISREDAYITQEEWERRFPTKRYPEGIASIYVAKHRNGPTGQVDLYFQKKTATFYSLAASFIPAQMDDD